MPKSRSIGKGKNMSIAKAALIVFYDYLVKNDHAQFIYSGDLDLLHQIIDVAGAKHRGPFTKDQVLSRINKSTYWKADATIPGRGNREAYCYTPSEKGIAYYEKHLKDKKIEDYCDLRMI